MVIVYHGLNDGEGFSYYFNGLLVRIDDSSSRPLSSDTGSFPGRMTLGSQFPLAAVIGNIMLVDEIVMWDEQLNEQLNETQIKRLAVAHLNDEL